MHALALRYGGDGQSMTLWLPAAPAARSAANLAVEKRLAVSVELRRHTPRASSRGWPPRWATRRRARALVDQAFECQESTERRGLGLLWGLC